MNQKMRSLYQVDAFTDTVFKGNPASVVYPADGLDEQTMLALSREFHNSETAFVYQIEEPLPIKIRFFTPLMEVNLCTHATIAAFHVLLKTKLITQTQQIMECKAGLLQIEASELIQVTQNPVQFGKILNEEERALLVAALGIQTNALVGSVQVVSTGNPKVLVRIRTKKDLDGIAYDVQALKTLGDRIGTFGFYCYTLETEDENVAAHARMFSPGSGIIEDPVTGNAAGALAHYLKRNNLYAGDQLLFAQGEAMNRKGYVSVKLHGDLATVSGNACTVFESAMVL